MRLGTVWVAEHLTLETQVAVKLMAPRYVDNEQSVVRFREEAQKTARIRNPHVTVVFDHGIMPEGHPYIVMELLDGETLRQRMKRVGPMPAEEVVRLVGQTAIGLDAAHKLGVVHRDIKPDNLFVLDVGGEPFVKVLDFGIAKQVNSIMSSTSTGVPMGTPLYMSPEQLDDSKRVDHRTDLWSLGVVAYEAFTGKCPFSGETIWQLYQAIQAGAFQPPTVLRPDLPQAVDAWQTRALSRDIDARYDSAMEMATALTAAFKRIVVVPENIGTDDTVKEEDRRFDADGTMREEYREMNELTDRLIVSLDFLDSRYEEDQLPKILHDRLLINLMKVVIEIAGARKGSLVLAKGSDLVVSVEAEVEDTSEQSSIVSALQSACIAEYDGASEEIVRYVSRTQESIVLDDTSGEGRFSKTPYFSRHPTKSVLCTPILNEGRLVGILYLENNLTTDAFNGKSLEVIGHLLSKIAIFIEHAILSEELGERSAQGE